MPVLDTDETTAGDVLCATALLTPHLPPNFSGELVGLSVYDRSGNAAELDVVLLTEPVNLGTPGAAVTIADEAVVASVARIVKVPTAAYTTLASGKALADVECGAVLVSDAGALYVGLIDRTGENTYAAGSLTVTAWVRTDGPG